MLPGKAEIWEVTQLFRAAGGGQDPVIDGAEMEEFHIYSLQRKQHCPKSEQVHFYPHVNPALTLS